MVPKKLMRTGGSSRKGCYFEMWDQDCEVGGARLRDRLPSTYRIVLSL